MSHDFGRFAALGRSAGAATRTPQHPGRLAPLPEFGSNPGGLKAHVHVPATAARGAPLVVVLHGCTQNAAEYDLRAGWSALADHAGFALLYPEQNHGNNPNLCFNWFRPGDARRDAGEALSIRQMIATMVEAHGLDPERIFVTGLSAGGAMASVMLATYPELFAGGAVIAGLAYGRATTVPEAFDCMRGQSAASDEELWRLLREGASHDGPWPKVAIWQGMADHTVAPTNAADIATQWRGVHHLGEAPSEIERLGPREKRVWRNAAGEAVIELNTVAGMGHGTPLSAELGVAGPYMLDVGISSTLEIAAFWGIAEPAATVAGRPAASAAAPNAIARTAAAPATSLLPAAPATQGRGATTAQPTGEPGHRAAPNRVAAVGKVIEDALRAAGLMR
ncbi:PHB depolymerase family esterase [Ancylobacter lacus]|nr:PHB depolymerase family esterase [Ancylobacter lacus]MBS7541324.1 PHB depolymerase family esterase [Ancylobacter lacus]